MLRKTQEETEVRTETRCHSCGATNTSDALACWRCQIPAPGGRIVSHQAPGWGVRPFDAPRRRRRIVIPRPRGFWSWVRWIVAAFFLWAGVHWYLGEQRVDMPETVGSAIRLDGADQDRVEVIASEIEDSAHAPADAAVYQLPNGRQFTVAAARVDATWATDVLQEFALGAKQRGVHIDLLRMYSFQSGGVDYACAPVNALNASYTCVWADGESVGVVTSHLRSRQLVRLVVQARDAIAA